MPGGGRFLADDAAAKADGYSVGARARLELGEQVAHVRLHRLLRQEETMPDLAIHEAVRDQLQDFDLTIGRLLLELPQGARERDHLAVPRTAPRSDLVEATGVPDIAAQDLLTLSCVHGLSIGYALVPL